MQVPKIYWKSLSLFLLSNINGEDQTHLGCIKNKEQMKTVLVPLFFFQTSFNEVVNRPASTETPECSLSCNSFTP